jgi:hypothetical protein
MQSLLEALWEKLLWWKKPKKTEYKFYNHNKDSTWIEITSGPYSGVIYSYGKVKLDQESVIPQLRFSFMVMNSGEFELETLEKDQDFVKIMGDILTEIIIENEPSRTNHH